MSTFQRVFCTGLESEDASLLEVSSFQGVSCTDLNGVERSNIAATGYHSFPRRTCTHKELSIHAPSINPPYHGVENATNRGELRVEG